MNFPVTPVPAQADAFIAASGMVRSPGDPYYHTAFGAPFQLHMVYDSSDPWATAAAPGHPVRAAGGGARHDTAPGRRRGPDGAGAGGRATPTWRCCRVTFTPYMSQTIALYTQLLGPPGKNGSQNWTGYSNSQFDALVTKASTAAQPEHGSGLLHAGGHHAVGRHGLAAPLRRADGPGLEPDHRRRQRRCRAAPACCGTPSCGRCGCRSRPATPRRRCRGSRGASGRVRPGA